MSIMGFLRAREVLTTLSATSDDCAALPGYDAQFPENFCGNFVATPPRASAGNPGAQQIRQENSSQVTDGPRCFDAHLKVSLRTA